ncbi:MAG TPA: hypothetical protein VJT31_01030, partial [Rugosimonospora sp.]|nr:hypothetical protein [Rugosimonospora sp.]
FGGGWLRVAAPEPGIASFWRSGRLRVEVRLPLDCALHVKTGAAGVRCTGRYASGEVSSGSGDVAVEHVTGDLALASGSGQITVDRAGARLSAKLAAGTARIGYAGGDATAYSASGDLEFGRVDGSIRAGTASGSVRIGAASTGTVRVRTASGAVRVGVTRGTRVWLDLNTGGGRTRTDLPVRDMPEGAVTDLTLEVSTAGGDIDVFAVEDATQRTR